MGGGIWEARKENADIGTSSVVIVYQCRLFITAYSCVCISSVL